jgi:hypothetical protein
MFSPRQFVDIGSALDFPAKKVGRFLLLRRQSKNIFALTAQKSAASAAQKSTHALLNLPADS